MTIRIQGEAGSGKTWLLNQLKQINKDWKFSSTTWISGLLIDSPTYYRKLRLNTKFYLPKALPLKRNHQGTLIIDEASMLSSESLDWLKTRYPKYTFILVGDWNQLPPVEGTPIREDQIDREIHLTGQHRQNNVDYYMFLQRFLKGDLSEDCFKKIKGRTITREEALKSDDLILCWHNSYYNFETERKIMNGRLDNISERDQIKMTSKTTPGKNVIGYTRSFRKNPPKLINQAWKNNEIFTIVGRLDNEIHLKNSRIGFFLDYETFNAYFDDASSLTIHKIQGQTIENNIIIDLDSIYKNTNLEEVGKLLYVALTRVRNWNQVRFIGKIGNPSFRQVKFNYCLEANNEELVSDNPSFLNATLYMSNKNNGLSFLDAKKNQDNKNGRIASGRIYFKTMYSTFSDGGLSNKSSPEHQFETLNPVFLGTDLQGHKTPRFTENVASFNRYLFECDDPKDKDFFIEVGKKIGTRITDSGNKSIHVVVSANGAKNIEEYKIIWNKINKNFFDGKADKACAEPARLTRSPNAIRDNGNKQELLFEKPKKIITVRIEKERKQLELERLQSINQPIYHAKPGTEIRADLTFEDGTWDLDVLKLCGAYKKAGRSESECRDALIRRAQPKTSRDTAIIESKIKRIFK